jgi:hypothetical protein
MTEWRERAKDVACLVAAVAILGVWAVPALARRGWRFVRRAR